jgi:predicted GNAT family N-acyltransferase
MDKIKVKIAKNKTEVSMVKEVRRQVFQIEQGINPKLDFDGKDDESELIIAYFQNEAVGTARIRYLSGKTAKLERLAVLKAYRKAGIGRRTMEYIVNYLQQKGVENIKLDSQEQAKEFYEKIGFKQRGKIFEEAGIPHVEMWKKI